MRIELIPDEIISGVYTEDELGDMNIVESFYEIRKLKALVHSMQQNGIIADKINSYGQAYIPGYDIWVDKNEFIKK